MPAQNRNKQTIEFGDFQTPPLLASQVCELLVGLGVSPASIIEPTCGLGQFILTALRCFPQAQRVLGVDINGEYVSTLRKSLRENPHGSHVEITCADFFEADWQAILSRLPKPLLVIGNPPWVTNARVSALAGGNLPPKMNSRGHRGIDAMTGKSNFDISEWIITHLLERFADEKATLAMLCKTSVARRVLAHGWKCGRFALASAVYLIDAARFFGASVDACLLVCRTGEIVPAADCPVYEDLDAKKVRHRLGYRNGQLVADAALYERWKHLQGESPYRWRSGIKHDCARVMELRRLGRSFVNGLGETVDIEDDCVFPLLKSSDLAKTPLPLPRRWMLVPQRLIGDDTESIRLRLPKTWAYLEQHAALLNQRASSIYANQPRFAVFGVGPYTFSTWKVAISGLYKSLDFKVVGSLAGKPIVLDDTTNFLSCDSRQEAEFLESLLSTVVAREFYGAFVQWDAKRPVTIDLLQRLDLSALAEELGKHEILDTYLTAKKVLSEQTTAEEPLHESLFANVE